MEFIYRPLIAKLTKLRYL